MPAPALPSGTTPPPLDALAKRVGAPWAVVAGALAGLPRAKGSWKFSTTSGWHLTYAIGARRLCYLFPQ